MTANIIFLFQHFLRFPAAAGALLRTADRAFRKKQLPHPI